jgi:hypothetical protein
MTYFCSSESEVAMSKPEGILEEVRMASSAFVFAGESDSWSTVLRDAFHASLNMELSDLEYRMSMR